MAVAFTVTAWVAEDENAEAPVTVAEPPTPPLPIPGDRI